jgi:nucleotide-binding universal stress UspA family protein
MIKTVLVPSIGDEDGLVSFSAALSVARELGAHIDVLHVRLDPVDTAAAMSWGIDASPLIGDLIETLDRDAREREARARQLFDEFCAREGLMISSAPLPSASPSAASAEWHTETGDEARSMVAYGLAADLIVAPRANSDQVTRRMVLEAVLLETGRPLLIPSPATPSMAFPSTVAIAWKPTPQAARAVSAAMPFLARAKDIVVMTVEEGDGTPDADRLIRNLGWHGLQATVERLVPNGIEPAGTLLNAAARKAELLVMGGYGHSRVREWVFGGFTQQALADAAIPVLMAH